MKSLLIIPFLLVAACKTEVAPSEPQHNELAVDTEGNLTKDAKLELLQYHNNERIGVSQPSLAWDNNLAETAKQRAIQLTQSSDNANSGENIYIGKGLSPAQIVLKWAEQEEFFTPGVFPDVSTTGRWQDVSAYTNIIWPSSRTMGCGMAKTQDMEYLVCKYSPEGNIHGEKVGI